ncbi:AAA family ATPase [Rhodanobacter denitrificans]|uniref:AAA family ATPase n=1 Tax=Rhodanobacter denitrificans TaxID=666685 RepID=UPI001F486B65|nr:AAA family ATPase [Rhodanobacter denitrificans]UJJ60590.1 AAA family ATPase [Rhodanobacter denitrificans]
MALTPDLAAELPEPLAATADDFCRWAEEGQSMLQRLSEATNEPNERRVLRTFRKYEALDLGGISEFRWKEARRKLALGDGTGTQARVTLEEIHKIQELAGVRPHKPLGSRTARVAVANFKGGATKTTVALHLGQACPLRGYRTLLVDADPQGTLSRLMGFRPETIEPENTLTSLFENIARKDGERVGLRPQPTHIDGLDIIPASLDMTGADIHIAAAFMQKLEGASEFYRLFDAALEEIEDRYDIIIIDTAPAFSFLALNVLWAANGLVIPLPPSFPDFSATVDFCGMSGDLVKALSRLKGMDKRWSPCAFTHSRSDNSGSANMVREFSSHLFGKYRIDQGLPKSSAFEAALGQMRSVYEVTSHDVDSRALNRARDASDQLASRLIGLIEAEWALQIAQATTKEATDE